MTKIKLVRMKPFTHNGKTYRPVVIKGQSFSDKERTMKNAREAAKKLGFITPTTEFVDIFRKRFSNQQIWNLGFAWLFIMHKPIEEHGYAWPHVTAIGQDEDWYERSLRIYWYGGAAARCPGPCPTFHDYHEWYPNDGFMFLAPEKEKS